MWASRGVPEVKFIQQEDTPGASRAIWAEFNGSRNDPREVGPKPGTDYFVAVLNLFLLPASIEMQPKVSVRRSISVQMRLCKILPSHAELLATRELCSLLLISTNLRHVSISP